jgi:multidrug resistance efflux pump
MIKALKHRIRPDNLQNQVRAGGKSLGRRIYLGSVVAGFAWIALTLMGPLVFLDADGLVMKERTVVASLYNARVAAVHVKPGDRVEAGTPLMTLQSADILDRMADVGGKRATLVARESQVRSRIDTLDQLVPLAQARRERAQQGIERMNRLAARQLTTNARQTEVARDLYEAEREEAQLSAERAALLTEVGTLSSSRQALDEVIEGLRVTFNGGRVVAAGDGLVGPRVPHPGQVLQVAERAMEIYRGERHVLAYVPTNRLYGLSVGDRVVVSEGGTRRHGRIGRIDEVTDAIPPEFQLTFRSVDRQQVMRIDFPDDPPFPVQAKVKVTSTFSPTDLGALVKALAGGIGGLIEGAVRAVAGLGGGGAAG